MKKISLLIFFQFVFCSASMAQYDLLSKDYSLLEGRYYGMMYATEDTTGNETVSREFPEPRSVLFKSLMIPGWGQIENRQIWKVPIIYGLFTGVGVYTYYLNGQYQDYRAAYYNAVQGEDSDFKFGPTPERLEGISANQLLSNRTSLRNQRDFMFVVFGLAYGLNALDAYVYAHMRSFDVSDDLSARATIHPTILAEGTPGLRLSFSLHNK